MTWSVGAAGAGGGLGVGGAVPVAAPVGGGGGRSAGFGAAAAGVGVGATSKGREASAATVWSIVCKGGAWQPHTSRKAQTSANRRGNIAGLRTPRPVRRGGVQQTAPGPSTNNADGIDSAGYIDRSGGRHHYFQKSLKILPGYRRGAVYREPPGAWASSSATTGSIGVLSGRSTQQNRTAARVATARHDLPIRWAAGPVFARQTARWVRFYILPIWLLVSRLAPRILRNFRFRQFSQIEPSCHRTRLRCFRLIIARECGTVHKKRAGTVRAILVAQRRRHRPRRRSTRRERRSFSCAPGQWAIPPPPAGGSR